MDERQRGQLLGTWEGYALGTIGRRPGTEEAKGQIGIELHLLRDQPRRCSGCGQLVHSIHDTEERWVKDLPILDAEAYFLVHCVCMACPTCGPKLEELTWPEPYSRVTRRLAESMPGPNTVQRSMTIDCRNGLLGWGQ